MDVSGCPQTRENNWFLIALFGILYHPSVLKKVIKTMQSSLIEFIHVYFLTPSWVILADILKRHVPSFLIRQLSILLPHCLGKFKVPILRKKEFRKRSHLIL